MGVANLRCKSFLDQNFRTYHKSPAAPRSWFHHLTSPLFFLDVSSLTATQNIFLCRFANAHVALIVLQQLYINKKPIAYTWGFFTRQCTIRRRNIFLPVLRKDKIKRNRVNRSFCLSFSFKCNAWHIDTSLTARRAKGGQGGLGDETETGRRRHGADRTTPFNQPALLSIWSALSDVSSFPSLTSTMAAVIGAQYLVASLFAPFHTNNREKKKKVL